MTNATKCSICPRNCNAPRDKGLLGYCQTSGALCIASVFPHLGEEPVISGEKGICNIFFPHCNLQCVFCQNYQISRNTVSIDKYITELEEVIKQVGKLLDSGIRSVGFVSPSHCIRQMKAIIDGLKSNGRHPIYVYNSNGYDKKETIKSLEGIINIYLPDLKYMESRLAKEYSDAGDYPDAAAEALKEMYRQKGSMLYLDENGIAESGLIIRHLILPNHIENSKQCLRFIAEELSTSVYVSLMAQYYPPKRVKHPELKRAITKEEYQEVIEEFYRLGFYRGFIQEIQSANDYRPDFSKPDPFGNPRIDV